MTRHRDAMAVLKLDVRGEGAFVVIGDLHMPPEAYAALLSKAKDQNSLTSFPIFTGGELKAASFEQSIGAYYSGNIIMEWQIATPQRSYVQGLFRIARTKFIPSKDGTIAFEIDLRVAGRLTFGSLPTAIPL